MKNNFFKINLYKNALVKFIKLNNLEFNKNKEKKINLEKLNGEEILNEENKVDNCSIDILVGILFLTEMNRYCKKNNIQVHGYYISYSLINLFIKLRNFLYFGGEIKAIEIINLIKNISINIEYFNTRIDKGNIILKKINNNYYNFMIELTKNLEELFNKDNLEKNNNSVLNNNFFIKNIRKLDENKLSKFFYILLMIAKYVGTGEYDEPNLIKLGQYYSNIFRIYLRLKNTIDFDSDSTDKEKVEVDKEKVEVDKEKVYEEKVDKEKVYEEKVDKEKVYEEKVEVDKEKVYEEKVEVEVDKEKEEVDKEKVNLSTREKRDINKILLEKYLKNKTILINSIINLEIQSDTIDEIIDYIESEIIKILRS